MSDDPALRSSRRAPRKGGLLQAVRSLTAAQQRTAAAALVVLVSLGLPWYSTEVVFPGKDGGPPSVSHGTRSGIGAFSFVEAAVLLVGVAVLVLVWARATDRRFSLPVTDGTVVTAAAGWLGLLVVYRLFDKPETTIESGTTTLVSLSWGIFASLAAVGLLLATGLDQRRRDAELRAATAAPPEGPVVDPADVVPAGPDEGRSGRGLPARAPGPPRPGDEGRPVWDGPAGPSAPYAPRQAAPARSAPEPRAPGPDAPEPGPPAVPGRPAWAGPASAPPGRSPEPPADQAPPSRSWSYADTDAPGPPPPRSPPSRRRPTPPPDGTARDDDPTRVARWGEHPAAPRDAPPADERSGRRRRRRD